MKKRSWWSWLEEERKERKEKEIQNGERRNEENGE